MINASSISMASEMKRFLEIVQPLKIKYGYARGIKSDESIITYSYSGSTLTKGIGNSIISERATYIVTVQTKTAEQCMIYSELIRRGTNKSIVEFVSDSIRKDTTVKDGWINTIILYLYTGLSVAQKSYNKDEVRQVLQEIADLYIFVTSMYDETLAQSFIDKLIVPELEQEQYTYEEFIQLKQEYVDRLLLTTIEY